MLNCSATLENKQMVMGKQLYTLRKDGEVAFLRHGHLGLLRAQSRDATGLYLYPQAQRDQYQVR
jgi:hypothetical protein